ncbi:hypothetical protein BT63DRAFT_44493 [Microthyrium microscopicum]|uniref:SnoaL-like domain-containing protein n=1 Tax=Microthyrium microscopicum TaxID=703497 RepID=A0A6A6U4Q7_9PEZI|nr:hypothetical protein BT63DRAFT_44493 [Microthyrium microscopicum]
MFLRSSCNLGVYQGAISTSHRSIDRLRRLASKYKNAHVQSQRGFCLHDTTSAASIISVSTMRFSTFLASAFASAGLATILPLPIASTINLPQPNPFEAIHQAENDLALILDTKDWNSISRRVTQDVVYDSTALGQFGGLSNGIDQFIVNAKAAFGNALVAHHVTNGFIVFTSPSSANVTTYITWSQWDPHALEDYSKTFRVFEKCQDVFVLQNGLWKLHYSKVTNLAPKVERHTRQPP